MIEPDESQNIWKNYDERLNASLNLNTVLLQSTNMGRAERLLRPLKFGLSFEIALNFTALLLLGGYIADTFGEIRFVLPAVVLFAAAWLILFVCLRQLIAIARIDFDEPVVTIQFLLERLRLGRIRTVYWTLVASPLIWAALVIMVARLLGTDVYSVSPVWLAANLAFAVAAVAGGMFFARRATAGSSRFADILAGRSLAGAQARLDNILRFISDDSPTDRDDASIRR